MTNDQVGIVAIGRNEGERLCRCIESMVGRAAVVVYVDSGSDDGSVDMARSKGVVVHELDMSKPFCAARARHEGFEKMLELRSDLQYVMFVDGDCEIVDGWLTHAARELDERSEVAVVCGRRRERYPQKTVYNRICDLEWDTPIGEANSCGGDAMMRIAAYQQVGGFDPTVPAGEEPQLCHRLRAAGWKVHRIDAEMTLHDAAMTKLGQFWRREVRTGYSGLDVQLRFGMDDFRRINRSARMWTTHWLWTGLITALIVGGIGWFGRNPATGLIAAAVVIGLMLAVYGLQIIRIARYGLSRGLSLGQTLAYGMLMMVGKWAQVRGQRRYLRDQRNQRGAQLVEYKRTGKGDLDLAADRAGYPPRPWLKEQSWWAIAVYRYGRRVDRMPDGLLKKIRLKWYWLKYRIVETLTGIMLPKEAQIGPGLRIYHFGNIIIHPDTKIGARCVLRHGVTIGNRVPDGPVPTVGDDVEFGAYAQVFGDIHIGDGAKIGAMSVVLCDVPAGATAVGVPARIVSDTSQQVTSEVDVSQEQV